MPKYVVVSDLLVHGFGASREAAIQDSLEWLEDWYQKEDQERPDEWASIKEWIEEKLEDETLEVMEATPKLAVLVENGINDHFNPYREDGRCGTWGEKD